MGATAINGQGARLSRHGLHQGHVASTPAAGRRKLIQNRAHPAVRFGNKG